MPTITLSIEAPAFAAEVERLKRNFSVSDFAFIWGRLAERSLRKSARAQKGRRFWSEIDKSIRSRENNGTVEILCDYRGVHKKFGGVILPKKGKALTIPIFDAKRTGKSVADYKAEGKSIFRPKGTSLLAYTDDHGDLHPLFILAKKVNQKPLDWYDEEDLAKIGIEQIVAVLNGAEAKAS